MSASAAPGQQPALGSRGAADAEAQADVDKPEPSLGGFDFSLTLYDYSGLETSPEAYENMLGFTFEPSFALGKRLFKGRWAEELHLSGYWAVWSELVGNDARFRGATFNSPTVMNDAPEQVAIAQARAPAENTEYRFEGLSRRAATSDVFVTLDHDKVYVLPLLNVVLGADLRLTLPASAASFSAGLRFAPALGLSARREFGPVTVRYGARLVQFFYASTVAPVATDPDPVVVNGQEVQPFRPSTTDGFNPNRALQHRLIVSAALPKKFGVSFMYALFHTWLHAPTQCSVAGVPTADLCASGSTLNPSNRGQQLDGHYFNADLSYAVTDYLSLSLGLSTFRPVRLPNGAISNPFISINRNNFSTAYLSMSASAEALVSAVRTR